jgi:hypothetical protein
MTAEMKNRIVKKNFYTELHNYNWNQNLLFTQLGIITKSMLISYS